MQANMQDLHRLREQTVIARAEALRLGKTALVSLLTKSIVGIDLTIAELEEDYARTRPQVEALKRLIGAT